MAEGFGSFFEPPLERRKRQLSKLRVEWAEIQEQLAIIDNHSRLSLSEINNPDEVYAKKHKLEELIHREGFVIDGDKVIDPQVSSERG